MALRRPDRAVRPRRRRGAVVVITSVSLVTLLLFGALAVDVGYIAALTAEMQSTADGASLAGVSALRDGDYARYTDRAENIISRNQKSQGFLSLDDQVIEVGRWDRELQMFTPFSDAEAAKGNSVRVVSKRNKVSLFFAPIMGKNSTNVAREAVAWVSPDCGGLWGINGVEVPGNVTVDSYFSTDGAYSALGAGENGDVCSNSDLTVGGSIEIFGDTMGDPVTVKGGSATVHGYVDTLSEPADIPEVDFGDIATDNDNGLIGLTDKGNNPFSSGWNLSIKANDNLTVPPGRYYFESVSFASGSSLTFTGETEIYLLGNFNESGYATFNTTGDPHDLTIYSKGDVLNISGSTEFYGSILAPNAAVSITGTPDFYGAIVCGTLKMAGNAQVHVDESLGLTHSLKGPPMLVK